MKRAFLTLTGILSLAAATLAGENPALDHFNKAVIFHASFDGKVDAELSPGSATPQSSLKAELQPFVAGLFGQALASGDFDLTYTLGTNVHLSRNGAAAIWVSSRQWNRENITYFWPVRIFGEDRMLMFGRMGDPRNKEALYGFAEITGAKGASALAGSSKDWKDGEWHLLVLNIRSETIEFSVDGQPPQQVTLNKPTAAPPETRSVPERITISTRHQGGDQFLMDELILFNAPLRAEEINWLYENGKQGKP